MSKLFQLIFLTGKLILLPFLITYLYVWAAITAIIDDAKGSSYSESPMYQLEELFRIALKLPRRFVDVEKVEITRVENYDN